jgi:hypothetical protein
MHRGVLYIAKPLAAWLLFTILYFGLTPWPKVQFLAAVIVTLAVMIVMCLGRAVV